MFRAGAVIGGKYELREQLHRKRDVWKVRMDSLEGVLKAPAPGDDHELRCFRTEKAVLRYLTGIDVQLLDEGSYGGRDFHVLSYIEGIDLARNVGTGTLGVQATLEVGVGICDKLAVVHAKEIVHFDIKPNNVIITSEGGVALIDYGLARPFFHQE